MSGDTRETRFQNGFLDRDGVLTYLVQGTEADWPLGRWEVIHNGRTVGIVEPFFTGGWAFTRRYPNGREAIEGIGASRDEAVRRAMKVGNW
jgi:hypothetical protein